MRTCIKERRPWQDSNLQSLVRNRRHRRVDPTPYPFGHRVMQANDVDRKTTLAGFEPAILGSSQAAALAELGRSHVRIQRLIHLATGSSATIVRKNNGTLTDLGSGCMGSENEGREIRTPNLLIWSQTRCRCAIPPLV